MIVAYLFPRDNIQKHMIEKDKGFSSVFYTAKVLIFIQLHKPKFVNQVTM